MAKETVKLISAEGYEFIVEFKAACVSTTIKNMLSSSGETGCAQTVHAQSTTAVSWCCHGAFLPAGSFTETELGEVKFPDISTPVLEKVCQYFHYKLQYQNA